MDLESIFGIGFILVVLLFVWWCCWVTSTTERLEKLRKKIGIPE